MVADDIATLNASEVAAAASASRACNAVSSAAVVVAKCDRIAASDATLAARVTDVDAAVEPSIRRPCAETENTCCEAPRTDTVANERGVSVQREGGKLRRVLFSTSSVRGFFNTSVAPATMQAAVTDAFPVSTTMGPP